MPLVCGLGALLRGAMSRSDAPPFLPLVLLVTVKAIRNGRWRQRSGIAVGLLLWLRQPCLLPFPNLWTIGALILFGVCAAAARDFAPRRSVGRQPDAPARTVLGEPGSALEEIDEGGH